MRRLFVGLILVSALMGTAFAENMQTANTVGQGKWSLTAAALNESNVFGARYLVASSFLGTAAYGINNKLDVLFTAGEWDMSPIIASLVSFGIGGKYAIMDETKTMPAFAGILGYKLINQYGSGNNTAGNEMLAQLEVSKTYGQFVPYAAAIYRTFAFADSDFDYTQIDLNLGSAISWSKQGSVYVEYTVQMFSLKNSSADPQNYTSNQFGAGVSYNL